jgi:hypothetical protein
VENNISLSNGGRGLEVFNNEHGASNANIYMRYNTVWDSANDNHASATYCGQIMIHNVKNVNVTRNLLVAPKQYGCGSNPVYAVYVGLSDGSNTVADNWLYSPWGYNEGINSSPLFNYGTNLKGTDPNFVSPSAPSAPSCSGKKNVPDCMSNVIANFTARASGATAYGYQPITGEKGYNSFFPQWLCNVGLPSGVINTYCSASSNPSTPAGLKIK